MGAPTPAQQPRPRLIGVDRSDVSTTARMQREYYQRHFPQIEWIRLNRDETAVHPTYREAADRRYMNPVRISAYIDHDPSRQDLKRWGIQEYRDIVVTFATVILDDLGLLENSSNFMIGDLIRFDDDLYEILTQHRGKEGYWTNTNVPMTLMCTCNRLQRGT